MNVEPMYLTDSGRYYSPGSFLSLRTILPLAVRQSFGSKHLAGTTFSDAHP